MYYSLGVVIITVLGKSPKQKPPIAWSLKMDKTGVATEVRPDPRGTKNNPTMLSAFPLGPTVAQIEILRRILQGHIGSLHVNSMHPSNVLLLQVLMEIMMGTYVGKFVGFMVEGGMNCRCLVITTAEHPYLLSSTADKIRLASK